MDSRLLVLAIGSFAGTMESFVLPGILPLMSADLSVSAGQAGYLVFGYSIAYAIAGPVLASLFGGADRRRALSTAELLFGACALLIAIAPLFILAVGGRMVLACGAVLFTTMAQATAVAITPPEHRGRAVSTVITGGTLAVAIGAPLGALLATQFGWRVTYGIVAALAITAGIVILMRLPKGLAGPQLSLRERLGVLRNPGIRIALLMSLLFMVGAFTPTIYVATMTTKAMGIASSLLPLVLFSNGVGAVIGGIAGGRVVDRFGPYRSFLIFASMMSIAMTAMTVLPLLPAIVVTPVWLLLVFLTGLGGWGLYAGQVALFAMLGPQSVPLAVSLNLSAVNIGAALAALLGGLVIDYANPASIGVTGAAFTLAAIAVAFGNRQTLRGER